MAIRMVDKYLRVSWRNSRVPVLSASCFNQVKSPIISDIVPGMRQILRLVFAVSTAAFLYAAPPTFDSAVKPIVANTCAGCHNDQLSSGGLNLKAFQASSSLEDREQWETILQKLRGGEMPPKGVPRPPQADIDALVNFVQGEYEKADRAVKPDPARVVSRRLNRNEYTNT